MERSESTGGNKGATHVLLLEPRRIGPEKVVKVVVSATEIANKIAVCSSECANFEVRGIDGGAVHGEMVLTDRTRWTSFTEKLAQLGGIADAELGA